MSNMSLLGRRVPWLRTLVIVLCLPVLVLPAGIIQAAPVFAVAAPSETIQVPYLAAAPYGQWGQNDKRYLTTLWNQAASAAAAPPSENGQTIAFAAKLALEMSQIQETIDQLRSAEGYLAPKGYAIYRPQTSGKLLALGRAMEARNTLLRYLVGRNAARPGAAFYPPLDQVSSGTLDLSKAPNPAKYASANKVAAALDYISVDGAALEGYEAYLLAYPYQGMTSALGGLGHTYIGARKPDTNADEVVVTHEFGHHFQRLYIGQDDTPATWQEYIFVRGLPGFQPASTSSNEADRDLWKRATIESFAEDFRLLMGSPQATARAPNTAYGDVRNNPQTAGAMRSYLTRLQTDRAPTDRSSALGFGIIGALTAIPRGLGSQEPTTTYTVTDRNMLPFLIASTDGNVSYWVRHGSSMIQAEEHLPLTQGMFVGRLDLSEGPGIYRVLLNAGSGASLVAREYYVIVRDGAVTDEPTEVALPAKAFTAWVTDPRLALSGAASGQYYATSLSDPRANPDSVLLNRFKAVGAPVHLVLSGGDGVYRAGATEVVVLDQPADPWSPPIYQAGQPIPLTLRAAVTTTRQVTFTGRSADAEVRVSVYDDYGQPLTRATVTRAPDGSFTATADLTGLAGQTYLIGVRSGPAGSQTLTQGELMALKVASAGGAPSSTSPSFLSQAAAAAAGGDTFWAAYSYLQALRIAQDRNDGTGTREAAQGLLGLVDAAHNYLLADAAAAALGSIAESDADTTLGRAYGRAYKRREAVKALSAATAVNLTEAGAAAALNQVSDPTYQWDEGDGRPRVEVNRLTDIDMWARAVIERMNAKGVILGFVDQTFRPDLQVRRDQAVTMVVRVLGLENEAKARSNDGLPYSDSASIASWARGYIATAYAHGLIDLREQAFRPSDPATRAEVAVMLVRGLGSQATEAAQGLATQRTTFTDDAAVPAWARGYLAYATQNGIITGYSDGTVRPGDPVRRSEMAALVGRIDDRTAASIDDVEVEGVLTMAEPGAPGRILVRGDDQTAPTAGTAYVLALNPSIYAGGKPVGLYDVALGSRLRLTKTAAGVVNLVEVLSAR
ncbi:MAG: S-layer homology domain-containing protein [Bacillota bacterium]